MAKLLFTYQAALDGRISAQERLSNELSVLTVDTLTDFDRAHPGAGLFFVAHVRALSEVIPFVTRRDQTLGHFGFSRDELATLVREARRARARSDRAARPGAHLQPLLGRLRPAARVHTPRVPRSLSRPLN